MRGEDSELIDRLVEAVNSPQGVEWVELAFYIVFSVGGRQFRSVIADTGREPVPGSVGAEERKHKTPAGRDAYLQMVRHRLVELTEIGVEEAFLVRALRNEVGRHVEELADTQTVTTNRERRREEISHKADDLDFVRAFRDQMVASDPAYQYLSDEEVQDQLRAMADRFGPRTIEDETTVWSLNDGWKRRVNELLSDAAIEDWLDRRARRSS